MLSLTSGCRPRFAGAPLNVMHLVCTGSLTACLNWICHVYFSWKKMTSGQGCMIKLFFIKSQSSLQLVGLSLGDFLSYKSKNFKQIHNSNSSPIPTTVTQERCCHHWWFNRDILASQQIAVSHTIQPVVDKWVVWSTQERNRFLAHHKSVIHSLVDKENKMPTPLLTIPNHIFIWYVSYGAAWWYSG